MAITIPDLEAVLPGAYVVAGRAIVFHGTTHYDLGEYIGDDLIVLNKVGQALVDSLKDEADEAPAEKPAAKPRKAKAAPVTAPTDEPESPAPDVDALELD